MNEAFSRRTALFGGIGLAGGLELLTTPALAQAASQQDDHRHRPDGGTVMRSLAVSVGKNGEYILPPLTYAYEALEPSIDAETMRLHHDKHHAAYVKGANEALGTLSEIRDGKPDASALSDLTEKLAFNLSGHLLHATFWAVMGPKGGEPGGPSRPTSESTSARMRSSRPTFLVRQSRFRGTDGLSSPTSRFRSA